MTLKSLSGLIFIVIFTSIAKLSFSSNSNTKTTVLQGVVAGQTTQSNEGDMTNKNMPFFPAPESGSNHQKSHSPQMDELAHIHKFHKERVKKIRKHHDKCWLLTKILLVICHVSILVIAFLHIIH